MSKKIAFFLMFMFYKSLRAANVSLVFLDSNIDLKNFSEQWQDKYHAPDFDYNRLEGESQNIIAKVLNWFSRKLSELFGFNVDLGLVSFFEKLFYIVLAIFVVYLIYKFLIGKEISSFNKKETAVNAWEINEEVIENTDFNLLIEKAIAQNKFNFAIRYLHLKTLQKLSEKNLIDWHFEKTNYDYLQELNAHNLKSDFKTCSYIYEHIWYGQFDINPTRFNQAKHQFDQLLTKINSYG